MERGFLQLFQEYTKPECDEAQYQELRAKLVAQTIKFITSEEPLNSHIQQLAEVWVKFPEAFEEIMLKVSKGLSVEPSEEVSRGISWLLKIWLEARDHSNVGFQADLHNSILGIRKKALKKDYILLLEPFAKKGLTQEFATVSGEPMRPKWKSGRRRR